MTGQESVAETGSLWLSVSPFLSLPTSHRVRDRHGRLLIAGYFQGFDEEERYHLARLHPNGALDTSFDPGDGADSLISALALQPDGRVLIGGEFSTYDGTARAGIARVNAFGYDLYVPAILRPN